MKAEKNRKKRFHCTSTSSAAKKDSPTIVIEDDDDEEPEDDLLEEAPKVKWGRSRRTKSQDAPGRKRIGDRWKELFPSNKKLNVSAVTIEDYVEANEASSDISIPIIITDDEADLNERRNTTKLPNSDGNLVHAAAGKIGLYRTSISVVSVVWKVPLHCASAAAHAGSVNLSIIYYTNVLALCSEHTDNGRIPQASAEGSSGTFRFKLVRFWRLRHRNHSEKPSVLRCTARHGGRRNPAWPSKESPGHRECFSLNCMLISQIWNTF